MTAPPLSDVEQLSRLAEAVERLRAQVGRRIVGQRETVDGILIAILAGGHALLIGVPGLAKTLMVSTVAESLHFSFSRVQ
ncbi:MAG: AAA family ATPase, partial [Gemmatimonadota bacterium]|nr:AAA family ATPase [Gemmatimonadota bacterium]